MHLDGQPPVGIFLDELDAPFERFGIEPITRKRGIKYRTATPEKGEVLSAALVNLPVNPVVEVPLELELSDAASINSVQKINSTRERAVSLDSVESPNITSDQTS